MKIQFETQREMLKVKTGTIAHQSMQLGYNQGEPLLFAMDGMLRYAKAYEKRFEQKLVDDYVLGPEYAKVISGLRALLNGDGAVAMERGITTDSKDNGVIEALYWACCEASGHNGEEI